MFGIFGIVLADLLHESDQLSSVSIHALVTFLSRLNKMENNFLGHLCAY